MNGVVPGMEVCEHIQPPLRPLRTCLVHGDIKLSVMARRPLPLFSWHV